MRRWCFYPATTTTKSRIKKGNSFWRYPLETYYTNLFSPTRHFKLYISGWVLGGYKRTTTSSFSHSYTLLFTKGKRDMTPTYSEYRNFFRTKLLVLKLRQQQHQQPFFLAQFQLTQFIASKCFFGLIDSEIRYPFSRILLKVGKLFFL